MERELLLLGLLREQGMHGYQLIEFIENQMAACVNLKKPTAYFLLDKMAAAGWISYQQGQEGNRPPRRVYNITPEGETVFQRLLRENLGSYSTAHFPTDIGFAFADVLPAEETLSLLQQRRTIVEAQLAGALAVPDHAGSTQLIIDHQKHHLNSELEWLNQVIERFTRLVKSGHKHEAKRQSTNARR